MRSYLLFLLLIPIFCCGCCECCERNDKIVKLYPDNFVTLRGTIDSDTTSRFLKGLLSIKSDEIYIYLITNGGSVIHGNDIIDAMKSLEIQGKKIVCIAKTAFSMGFAIFQACPTRYVTETSSLMQHQVSFSVDGNMENVKSRVKYIVSIEKQLSQMEAKRLNLSLEEYNAKVNNDWWLYGEEAIDEHVADQMVQVICDFDIGENRIAIDKFDFFGNRITFEYSLCPLIKDPINVISHGE